jgi:hypothetical protein
MELGALSGPFAILRHKFLKMNIFIMQLNAMQFYTFMNMHRHGLIHIERLGAPPIPRPGF